MRLATWNCNQAFRRKQHELLDLEPDIAVVPECEHPEEKGDWSAWTDWRWTGDNPHKGLGVFTRNDITISDTTVSGKLTTSSTSRPMPWTFSPCGR